MKLVIRLLNGLIVAAVLFIAVTNIWMVKSSEGKIFDSVDNLPQIDTAIVFGTSKSKVGGGSNPFFDNRMKAASELYHAGKVKTFILSGSKEEKYYNEPRDMRKALIKLGLNSDIIVLDTAGTRTIETIKRARHTYNLKSTILITQEYYAHRALFLSNGIGITAVCYKARFPDSNYSIKTALREILARPKAVVDLYL